MVVDFVEKYMYGTKQASSLVVAYQHARLPVDFIKM